MCSHAHKIRQKPNPYTERGSLFNVSRRKNTVQNCNPQPMRVALIYIHEQRFWEKLRKFVRQCFHQILLFPKKKRNVRTPYLTLQKLRFFPLKICKCLFVNLGFCIKIRLSFLGMRLSYSKNTHFKCCPKIISYKKIYLFYIIL